MAELSYVSTMESSNRVHVSTSGDLLRQGRALAGDQLICLGISIPRQSNSVLNSDQTTI